MSEHKFDFYSFQLLNPLQLIRTSFSSVRGDTVQ